MKFEDVIIAFTTGYQAGNCRVNFDKALKDFIKTIPKRKRRWFKKP